MTPLQALQATLAGEHAAVYLYGVLGSRASATTQPALYRRMLAGYRTHRVRRDELSAMITTHGGTPVGTLAAYDIPVDLGTPAALDAVALRIERRAAATYGQLCANSTGPDRAWALAALDAAAVAELDYGGAPEQFPG